jgi:hypothetical protein
MIGMKVIGVHWTIVRGTKNDGHVDGFQRSYKKDKMITRTI